MDSPKPQLRLSTLPLVLYGWDTNLQGDDVIVCSTFEALAHVIQIHACSKNNIAIIKSATICRMSFVLQAQVAMGSGWLKETAVLLPTHAEVPITAEVCKSIRSQLHGHQSHMGCVHSLQAQSRGTALEICIIH